MMSQLDKDLIGWLNEPNKKEALAEIKAFENAINRTSQRILFGCR